MCSIPSAPTGPTPIDQWSDDFCKDLNRHGVRWHDVQYEEDDDSVYLRNDDDGTERHVAFDRVHEAQRFAEVAGAYAEDVA